MPEDDLVMLDSHNEAMLIHNLRVRYEANSLYTWVGAARSVLISVNPYKKLPLYGKDQIKLHQNRPPNKPLPPHVFDIAHDSYQSMMFENKDQSILISGESGAGKTVCTKQCLDFLAEVAGSESGVEEKIVMANPLLEAFGNAQTIRNNNSSRFGKWIEVHFDNMERSIQSAVIIDYLLEKSRVVYQQEGERNYHVFYQLCDSGSASDLGLGEASTYEYLNKSGCYKAKDIDDVQEHDEVLKAMDLLGFSAAEKEFVLRLTAGVLTLGNIQFDEKAEKGSVTGSAIREDGPLSAAASFLNVTEEDLAAVLCYRSISVRGKTSTIPLDPSKARKGCDSLAMGVYSRLFSFLVQRVNDALAGKQGKFIGILDIFGFEIFDQNSFEQLCINFANEKLQQQFNRTTFKEEEALYMKEGIEFEHVEFIDNQAVLDLIEARPNGILLMIDDEIKIPEGSDAGFLNKIETLYKRNSKFQTDKHRKIQNSFNFEIEHYAGVVNYNGDGFMDKNTDTLYQDMYDMCASSESPEMQQLFPPMEHRRQMVSLSSQFRRSLNELMESLYSTESRYIRCVKPNKDQVPDRFQSPMVIDQLRYSGVFEAVEIRKTGFPFRLTYSVFACRYSCINKGHTYRSRDEVELAKEILSTSKQNFDDVQFGKTMVLYRAREYKILELLRNLALETIIPMQQAVQRGHLAREFKRRALAAQKAIQDALDVGNDIDMLDAAIDAVEETIGTFGELFPNGKPANLAEAKKHRANLALWKALEARLEKLVDSDPNQVYGELAEAVKESQTLMHIPRTARQDELVEQAISLRASCELGKIDFKAVEVLKTLDRDGMEDVASRAAEYGHTNEEIDEINRLLRLPEIEFVALEIEKAKEMNDDQRRIDREIRYESLFLDAHARDYKDFGDFDGLKDPEAFGKVGGIFGNKAKRAQQMLVYTKAAPATSLTVLEGGKPQEKEATKIAKLMREFAGDKKSKIGPEAAAAEALAIVRSASEEMVDEVYLQVLKQVTQNATESVVKYYEFLGLLMCTRSPSKDIERYVVVHLLKHAPDDLPAQRFTSALHETQYGKGQSISAGQIDSALDKFRTNDAGSRWSLKR
ncbi:High molecular weight form of myosin-1 (High molecular weight form of myosin I) (HMWMI) [Durusdinium trenchii]|uniref:High molecular weight form of myosin-1 (High molecular weight form of myosin I) (HMWMI) n=1 Tax=Durusdinium trenchii TaxID=1381693 RepID=A0ABP0SMP8_9DINO